MSTEFKKVIDSETSHSRTESRLFRAIAGHHESEIRIPSPVQKSARDPWQQHWPLDWIEPRREQDAIGLPRRLLRLAGETHQVNAIADETNLLLTNAGANQLISTQLGY